MAIPIYIAALEQFTVTNDNFCSSSFQLRTMMCCLCLSLLLLLSINLLQASRPSHPIPDRRKRRSHKISLMSFIHQIVTITQFIIVDCIIILFKRSSSSPAPPLLTTQPHSTHNICIAIPGGHASNTASTHRTSHIT